MARKDTSKAVLSMLSTVGEQTRRSGEGEEPEAGPRPVSGAAASDDGHRGRALPDAGSSPVAVTVTPLESAAGADSASDAAPRTMRLRAATAAQLRAAWLEAKRDDVLLTAQDFASNLVDEALGARRRRGKALRST